jgi:glutathione-regulated potassium-efflux system ancillary protein KefG
MGDPIDPDELIDAADVAKILDLAQPNSVYLYQRRYPDMPRPVVDRGKNRAKLWVRGEVQAWARARRQRSAASRSRL